MSDSQFSPWPQRDSPEPVQPAEIEDPAIAEFHRAARRKKAWVFGVAAAFCLAIGITVVVIGVYAGAPDGAIEGRAVVAGVVLIVAGLGAARSSYRLATGQVDDAELGATTHRLR
ncbi:MAG TPA: hypothetical protein VFD36_29910 [Kofleriaceae bacterium]|nr:hypothetical protein [Kofleriaceae bacterium]